VTISTGIGGGWILNGRPYAGADGLAGEIGHLVVQPGGFLCPCGKYGCLEAEASGPGDGSASQVVSGQEKGKARSGHSSRAKRLLELARAALTKSPPR